MRKLLIVFALLSIVLISGCVNDDVTGNVILEDDNTYVTYYDGECRRDTDCLVVYCRDTPELMHCMDTVQVLTEVKCQELGGIASEKDYEACGCVEGICK